MPLKHIYMTTDLILSSCNSITTFDFPIMCFIKKNGQRRYKYPVLGMDIFHLVKTTLTLIKLSETDIIKILEFLIDKIFMFGGIHVGVKLCSSSRRLAPSFVRERPHTRASPVKRKEAGPILKYALLSRCSI